MLSAGRLAGELSKEFQMVQCERGLDDVIAHRNVDAVLIERLGCRNGALKSSRVVGHPVPFRAVVLDANVRDGGLRVQFGRTTADGGGAQHEACENLIDAALPGLAASLFVLAEFLVFISYSLRCVRVGGKVAGYGGPNRKNCWVLLVMGRLRLKRPLLLWGASARGHQGIGGLRLVAA